MLIYHCKMKKNAFFFLLLTLISFVGKAQDSLSTDLNGAENIFLKENLFLLSEQYNIDAKNAIIIQAKAYPNPVFSADVNVYDPTNQRYFHVDNSGQKSFYVEQLILLGGKRRIEIDIAKQNKDIAEAEFSEMLRKLKAELHKSFYSIHQMRIVIENFDKQLKILDTIITAYQQQANMGNIPVKDVIRLKSVFLKINTERSELSSNLVEEIQKIQLLLHTSKYILPKVDNAIFDTYSLTNKTYDDLLKLANENRPDLKIATGENSLAMLNFTLQKRMAIPDIAINGSYDQRGGAFVNQVNAGFRIPIPVWDRNRGNIKAADADRKAAEIYLQQKTLEVQTDVQAAFQNISRSIEEYKKMKILYTSDFEAVFKGVNENFQKRNISMLEFVDFFEAYNESIKEFERIRTQLAISAGQINYVTASQVY
jgi:cobalt-zinc-cadmium efflux system outer membrane protein